MSAKDLLAPDTNLLAFQTSRRLLHGVARKTGCSLAVLPEVFKETRRLVSSATEVLWSDRLEQDPRLDTAHKQSIASALAQSAVEALKNELRSAGDNIVFIVPTLDEEWAARRIARNLPQRLRLPK